MNSVRTDEHPTPSADLRQPGDVAADNSAQGHVGSLEPKSNEAVVVVRGETVSGLSTPANQSAAKDSAPKVAATKEKAPRKEVSEAKLQLKKRLPALDDDREIGVQKEQVVTRDGKADLAFTGTLVASAAPSSAPKDQWKEYRIYETTGGKHVFSKVTRRVFVDEQDTHEAEVFDPSPSSVPSQLLRTARDLTRSHPLTWKDAAVHFFGYDPLAKDLYRRIGGEFEEHIG